MSAYTYDDRTRLLKPFELDGHLRAYCAELADAGYQPLTIKGHVDSVCHFGTWLHHHEVALEQIDPQTLDRFSTHCCHCPGARREQVLSRRYVNRARRFVCFLVGRGLVRPVSTPAPTFATDECEAFGRWLLDERGLSSSTVASYRRSLARILPALGSDPTQYSATLIRSVVKGHAQEHGVVAAKHLVSALRAFLRFLTARGLCRAALVDAVPTVPRWRLSSLPRYVGTADLERIVDSCDTTSPTGLRDRAILLLLARLGLRARDIVDLTITDIDWSDATVRVCGKSRREARLPLPQDTGDAILSYLGAGRPDTDSTRLFLCTNAPHRHLGGSPTVSSIVRVAVARAGVVDPPSRGTNLMRHSAATSMLRSGATLDAVSTILRHRSTDTTMHYAKVDVVRSSALAVPWPRRQETSSC